MKKTNPMDALRNQIAGGLQRKSITKCSDWALRYRHMGTPFPGPWTFRYHPWTRTMHDADDEMIVGQKAAQLGFTEWVLNKAFFHIDIHGESVLYVLPASTPDASDFSSSRFDPALELSPHLRNLFSEVKNVGHKRAGNANLFIRGSRSEAGMRSIPAGRLIFDEVDVMVQKNIELAFERASGQVNRQIMMLSTPTIDNYGINAYFQGSTQDHFMFKCPYCSVMTELIFPECLEIVGDDPDLPKIMESFIKCKECGHRLPDGNNEEREAKADMLAKGQWVSSYTDRISRGFHVNQLYSMTVPAYRLAILFLRSISNPAAEQEFYNSKLGVPHAVDGAKITDKMIESCTCEIKKQDTSRGLTTIGIDVGGWLHYEICSWKIRDSVMTNDVHLKALPTLVMEGKVKNFEELDILIRQYGVNAGVIDANPERRKALEFCQRWPGMIKMCYYGNGVTGKQIKMHEDSMHSMTVDRTSWLDMSLGRFKDQSIRLPVDLSAEYKNNIKALVRIYKEDNDGNPVGKYVRGNDDDHFAHAHNYCELALGLAVGMGVSQDIV